MPTYDYECKSCGYNFEVFQGIMDPPLKKCPQCGKSVRRLIGGGTGIIFKGSGFYVTDSRKSSSKGGSTKSSAGTESKTETKAETKTETSTESKSDTSSSSKSGTTKVAD